MFFRCLAGRWLGAVIVVVVSVHDDVEGDVVGVVKD
jgi:hypothetical protein